MAAWIIALFALVTFSGIFSAAEIAYTEANRLRLENQKEDGDKKAGIACFICEHFELAEGALILSNTAVNICAGTAVTCFTVLHFGAEYLWLSTIIITLVIVVFGETIPKIVAIKNASRLSVGLAYLVMLVMCLLSPIIGIVNLVCNIIKIKAHEEDEDISEELAEMELQAIIETVEDEGVIDEGRSELLQAALDFSSISAVEVMTARVDVLAIDIDEEFTKIQEIIHDSPHSRLPIYEGSLDNIIGVLYLNHYFREIVDNTELDLRTVMIEPCYVYKTMKLPLVLGELKRKKTHIAVVTDEYGGSMGIITMEDVLEELVGEIWDETDVIEEEVVETASGVYELEGDVSIGEFTQLCELDEDSFETDSTTVGGWCMEKLGRFAVVGDEFIHENLKISISEVDGLRIDAIRVELCE